MILSDITGQKFGKLTALRRVPRVGRGNTKWVVRCDCGTEREIAMNNLKNGHTKSCGCAQPTIVSAARTVHGHNRAPHGKTMRSITYVSWQNMRARCMNPKSTQYRWYGARGIQICEEWRNSFVAFLRDMGERPSVKYSIERKNNDGNYEPANCCWATALEQARNTRKAKKAEVQCCE